MLDICVVGCYRLVVRSNRACEEGEFMEQQVLIRVEPEITTVKALIMYQSETLSNKIPQPCWYTCDMYFAV